MGGLTHTLNIAKLGLSAQQLGLNVTGHNIANVNNPNFSRQSVPQASNKPVSTGGFLLGNGVSSQDIQQTADQLLEDRLTTQKSSLSASEAFMNYMKVMEGIFNEDTDASLSKLLPDYWDSWNALANNPSGSSERVNVYQNGVKVAAQFDYLDKSLSDLEVDLGREIESTLVDVNRLADEIAKVNQTILTQQGTGSPNDSLDFRNQLVKELGSLVDLRNFENPDGSLTVTTAGGFTLVSGVATYDLKMEGGQVKWESSSGGFVDITDKFTGGKIGGWLEMRDVVVPQYRRELDTLARETIWNVNEIHSRGAGTSYFDTAQTGTYTPDKSGWLSTLPFGDRIDYTKDFGLWVKNDSTSQSEYAKVDVDMGISDAVPKDWFGVEPNGEAAKYEFTVVREGAVGEAVTLADGTGLGTVQTGSDAGAATNKAIARQTITVTDPDGTTHTITVRDQDGDAKPSAASIVDALNEVDGIQAYASENEMVLDMAGLLPGVGDMQENDTVSFSLVSGNLNEKIEFRIGADAAATRSNFQSAMTAALAQSNDLTVSYNGDTATLTSAKGENLGIENFDVVDNATITLDTFVEDTGGAGTASFDLDGVTVSFSLDAAGGQAGIAANLMAGLNREAAALSAKGITFALNTAGTGVTIIGAKGGSLDIANVNSGGGNDDGGFTVTGAAGTEVAGTDGGAVVLAENGTAQATVAPNQAETATLGVDGATLTETGGAGDDSAVKVANFTMFSAPGIRVTSDGKPGQGSVFNVNADFPPASGNAILTLGGDGGFAGFDAGDTVAFTIDGVAVSYTVGAGDDTDEEFAAGLVNALRGSGLEPSEYTITRVGTTVSILKSEGSGIDLTGFDDDDGSGAGNAAGLKVVTGSGFGTDGASETILTSGGTTRVSSAVFGTGAAIAWRKLDENGDFTGTAGRIDVRDSGPYTFDGTLQFNLNPGSLVAGNTFSITTDDDGVVSPLDLSVSSKANSVNDTYVFHMKKPGGQIGKETVTLTWENRFDSGEVTLEVTDKTKPPIYVEVDGMKLAFNSGEMFRDDTFVIQTDQLGKGSLQKESDWHWTSESFVDQFNRQSPGITAKVNLDDTITFTPDSPSFEVSDVGCSGVNGFCDVNSTVKVLDHTAFTEEAMDFRFSRDGAGNWSILNDYTHGVAQLVPPGGDDSGFGVDLTGDGLADMQIDFSDPVTGSGYVEFDILARDPEDYSFAFSGEDGDASGLAAALGVNTFYTGTDAMTMDVNKIVSEAGLVNAGRVDADTGEIRSGDSVGAKALAELQAKGLSTEEWTVTRDGTATSTAITSSVEGYYQVMVSSMGVISQSEQRSMSFNATMVANLSQQRDSISAVSLDEEMINLIKYQQAFTAAAKLLTTSDEMLNTLVSMR